MMAILPASATRARPEDSGRQEATILEWQDFLARVIACAVQYSTGRPA